MFKQRGFSLIEIMIAMATALGIVGLVVKMGVTARDDQQTAEIIQVLNEIKVEMRTMYAGRVNIRYDAPQSKIAERSSRIDTYWNATRQRFEFAKVSATIEPSSVVMLGKDGVTLPAALGASFRVTTSALSKSACSSVLVHVLPDAAGASVASGDLSASVVVPAGKAMTLASITTACSGTATPRLVLDFN